MQIVTDVMLEKIEGGYKLKTDYGYLPDVITVPGPKWETNQYRGSPPVSLWWAPVFSVCFTLFCVAAFCIVDRICDATERNTIECAKQPKVVSTIYTPFPGPIIAGPETFTTPVGSPEAPLEPTPANPNDPLPGPIDDDAEPEPSYPVPMTKEDYKTRQT